MAAAVCLAICALLLAVPAAFAEEATPGDAGASGDIGGFAVMPLMIETESQPGTSTPRTITVSNTTTERINFTIGKEDVAGNRKDPEANPVLLGGKSPSPISGYDWLTGLPESLSVGPGDSKNFTVSVNVPSGATGGHYAAVTITGSTVRIGDVSTQSRVAVLFMMNAGGVPPPEIVIEDVVVTEDGDTVIDYVNKGGKEVRPAATITYVDAITGKTVTVRTQKECGIALPGAAGRCIIEAEAGRQKGSSGLVKPTVELVNEGRTAKADMPVEWSGSAGSLVLPLVGLGLLALYVYRRRRSVVEEDDLFPA